MKRLLDPKFRKQQPVEKNGYRLFDVYESPGGTPVVIQMSEAADPPHWYIQDGISSIYFLTYKEVAAYINRRKLRKTTRF